MTSLTAFSASAIDGQDVDLSTYAGKVVLVVNTASQCGFTPQYKGLQELYEHVRATGLHRARLPVRPVRPPGARRRGRDRGVLRAQLRRHVPDVRQGRRQRRRRAPAVRWLREEKGGLLGDAIKWNFTKFLVGRDGQVIERYAPTTEPEKLADDIEKALAGSGVERRPATTTCP